MPASWSGVSGRTRFASGSNETMFECRKSRAVDIVGSASTARKPVNAAGGASVAAAPLRAEDRDGAKSSAGATHGSAPALSTPSSSAVTTASGSRLPQRAPTAPRAARRAASSGTAHAVPSSLIPPQSA